MMGIGREEPSDPRILEELSPGLRDAVEQVLRDSMPEDLVRCALERAQCRLTPGEHHRAESATDRRIRASGYNQKRMVFWTLLATSASIGLIAIVMHFRASGTDSRHVVSVPLQQVAGSKGPASSDGNVPTAWAYTQAARQSPEALDALLDLHVTRSFSADRWSCPEQASLRAVRQAL